jgi:hypothetical protein
MEPEYDQPTAAATAAAAAATDDIVSSPSESSSTRKRTSTLPSGFHGYDTSSVLSKQDSKSNKKSKVAGAQMTLNRRRMRFTRGTFVVCYREHSVCQEEETQTDSHCHSEYADTYDYFFGELSRDVFADDPPEHKVRIELYSHKENSDQKSDHSVSMSDGSVVLVRESEDEDDIVEYPIKFIAASISCEQLKFSKNGDVMISPSVNSFCISQVHDLKCRLAREASDNPQDHVLQWDVIPAGDLVLLRSHTSEKDPPILAKLLKQVKANRSKPFYANVFERTGTHWELHPSVAAPRSIAVKDIVCPLRLFGVHPGDIKLLNRVGADILTIAQKTITAIEEYLPTFESHCAIEEKKSEEQRHSELLYRDMTFMNDLFVEQGNSHMLFWRNKCQADENAARDAKRAAAEQKKQPPREEQQTGRHPQSKNPEFGKPSHTAHKCSKRILGNTGHEHCLQQFDAKYLEDIMIHNRMLGEAKRRVVVSTALATQFSCTPGAAATRQGFIMYGVKLCIRGFARLLTVSTRTVNRLNSEMKECHGRMHSLDYRNKYRVGVTYKVKTAPVAFFVRNYARQHGLPCPMRNRFILHASTTRRKVHEAYVSGCPAHLMPVRYSRFCDIWKKELRDHIKFAHRGSGFCDMCTVLRENSDQLLLKHHQDNACIARYNYQGTMHWTRQDKKKRLFLSFDYAQSRPLPQFAQQPANLFFLSSFMVHRFGISDETNAQDYAYAFGEDTSPYCKRVKSGKTVYVRQKTGEAIASMLWHRVLALEQECGAVKKHIRFQCDNCVSQNKNKIILWFMAMLTMRQGAVSVFLTFMAVGHTKLACDRCFGVAACHCQKHDIFTPSEYRARLDECAPSMHAVNADRLDWICWLDLLQQFFCMPPGLCVTGYRQFRFNHDDPGIVWCLRDVEDANPVEFQLLKPGVQPQEVLDAVHDVMNDTSKFRALRLGLSDARAERLRKLSAYFGFASAEARQEMTARMRTQIPDARELLKQTNIDKVVKRLQNGRAQDNQDSDKNRPAGPEDYDLMSPSFIQHFVTDAAHYIPNYDELIQVSEVPDECRDDIEDDQDDVTVQITPDEEFSSERADESSGEDDSCSSSDE